MSSSFSFKILKEPEYRKKGTDPLTFFFIPFVGIQSPSTNCIRAYIDHIIEKECEKLEGGPDEFIEWANIILKELRFLPSYSPAEHEKYNVLTGKYFS